MKHYVKQTMALLIVLAMTLVSLPIFADGEFTQESDLAQPESFATISGFSLEAWQYDKCGYSEQRNVYTCMANDAYMIFDAGKNNAYTSAEIKVAYNSTGNYWAFTEEVHRKNGYVQVSDDGKNWTSVTDSTLADAASTTGGFYSATLKFTLEYGYRYIRVNTYVPGYDPNFYPIGAWNFFIHGVKLSGAKAAVKPMLDTDLTSAAANVNVFDFSYPSWDAYSRCGYTSARNIYLNNSADSYMIFGADNGKIITGAEITITYHAQFDWIVSQNVHRNGGLLQISDDGETWTNAVSTYELISHLSEGGAESGWGFMTSKLIVDYGEGCRYVKLNATNFGASQLYVHHARLYGGDTFAITQKPALTVAEGKATVTGAYKNIGSTGDTVILGVYSGNMLKKAVMQNIVASNDENTINLTADITNSGDNLTYKLFIWSQGSFAPLTEMIPLS